MITAELFIVIILRTVQTTTWGDSLTVKMKWHGFKATGLLDTHCRTQFNSASQSVGDLFVSIDFNGLDWTAVGVQAAEAYPVDTASLFGQCDVVWSRPRISNSIPFFPQEALRYFDPSEWSASSVCWLPLQVSWVTSLSPSNLSRLGSRDRQTRSARKSEIKLCED